MKYTDFFAPEVQRVTGTNDCSIYKMNNETGEGIVTQYHILPGIEFFYNDFHMSDGHNKNKLPMPNTIEINHCREGRFECEFKNGDFLYVGAGDFSIHRLTQETAKTSFPMSHYHGISITIDLNEAAHTIKALEGTMGNLDIDLGKVADCLCRTDTCFVVHGKNVINHIFSEFYCARPEMIAHYLKVKVLELLMCLNNIQPSEYIEEKRYFSRNQVDIVKSMHDFMIKDLSRHYTLKELSARFEIPLTSMKVCFKGIYGCSVYSYMKSYRMQAARILLKSSNLSVTEIATKMGYDNPSKFSECFKNEFNILPSDIRKTLSE